MISMQRIISYEPTTDVAISRLDVLYGWKVLRPEWTLIVPETYISSAPAIISAKELIIVGTAAILIKNPIVSRRFWSGWTK